MSSSDTQSLIFALTTFNCKRETIPFLKNIFFKESNCMDIENYTMLPHETKHWFASYPCPQDLGRPV